MGCFQVRYDSRVVNYKHKLFIRLTTGWRSNTLTICLKVSKYSLSFRSSWHQPLGYRMSINFHSETFHSGKRQVVMNSAFFHVKKCAQKIKQILCVKLSSIQIVFNTSNLSKLVEMIKMFDLSWVSMNRPDGLHLGRKEFSPNVTTFAKFLIEKLA